MAANRLTLFDIIADLIPGIVYLVFLVPFVSAESVAGFPFTIFGAAIVVLALGYAIGRIIHALASRSWVKCVLKRLAWRVGLAKGVHVLVGSKQLKDIRGTGPNEGKARWGDFDFRTRINAHLSEQNSDERDGAEVIAAYEHAIIEEMLERARTKIDFVEDPEEEDPANLKWESDTEYLEHVGHCLLFGESTLYQQYTILATFYRNLWVTIIAGIFSAIIVYGIQTGWSIGPIGFRSVVMVVMLFFFILLILTLLSVRWLEFRYRRLRAFVNEMYLALEPSEPKDKPVDWRNSG